MKKLFALILVLLMLCSCNSEPEEIKRELNGEPARGVIESGMIWEYDNESGKRTDREILPEEEVAIGKERVYDAVYYNESFGMRIGLNASLSFENDTHSWFQEQALLFANGSTDPSNAEFYDLYSWGGEGFGTIGIRYENMAKFRGKILSEKDYSKAVLDEFANRLEAEKFKHYEDYISLILLDKEIDTVKIDGENLYCLKYHVAVTELDIKYYFGIVIRKTGDWMTNIIVSYSYSPGMEYAAKCIEFD